MSAEIPSFPTVPGWQRRLLPGDLVDGSSGRRTAQDWVLDVLAALAAIGIGAVVLGDTENAHSEPELALDLVLGALSWCLLWVRRSRPVAVALFAVLASIISGTAAGPALVATFTATVRGPWRGVLAVVIASVIAAAAYPLVFMRGDYWADMVLGELFTAVIIGWALFGRARRDLVLSLRDRGDRLETEQRLKIAQAREAERRRIASEMHDVLAHRISLLSVHAGALEFRPDAPPAEIAEAAGVIRASAHGVLDELRDVIGVLRDGGEDGDLAAPQPALGQIPALVEESRGAGARVRLLIGVAAEGGLPAVLGRTAFRVVQEGLTNARKHAPAAAVEVTISGEAGNALVTEVVSRRPVRPATGDDDGEGVPGWGTGLVGLAERVTLAGGTLVHGPDASGDFVLRATLPWPAP